MGPKDIVELANSLITLVSERDLWTPVLTVVVTTGFVAFMVGRLMGVRKARLSAVKAPECPGPHLSHHDRVALDNLHALTRALDQPNEELWQLHKSAVPRDVAPNRSQKMRVVTFANLKGGVGKTTVAANLAAYFNARQVRTLLIDFDYQGSLSSTVLQAAGRQDAFSESEKILSGALSPDALVSPLYKLGGQLAQISLIPAAYELNRQETRLLMRWLLRLDEIDPRFALARILADATVRDTFELVLVDTPPRLTLATINALCASTHVIVPTIFDRLATENVGDFLRQINHWFRADLNPSIELAGVVGTMTPTVTLGNTERQEKQSVAERAIEAWGPDAYMFSAFIPDTARFRQDAGRTIAYLDPRQENVNTRQTIDALGAEVARRIGL